MTTRLNHLHGGTPNWCSGPKDTAKQWKKKKNDDKIKPPGNALKCSGKWVKVETKSKQAKIEYSNFHSSKQQSDGSLRRDNDLIESEYCWISICCSNSLEISEAQYWRENCITVNRCDTFGPQLAQRQTNEANVHLVKTVVADLQGEEKCTSSQMTQMLYTSSTQTSQSIITTLHIFHSCYWLMDYPCYSVG